MTQHADQQSFESRSISFVGATRTIEGARRVDPGFDPAQHVRAKLNKIEAKDVAREAFHDRLRVIEF